MDSIPSTHSQRMSQDSSSDASTDTPSDDSPRSSQDVDKSTESSIDSAQEKTSDTSSPQNRFDSEYVNQYRKAIRKRQLLGTRCRARTVANDIRGNLSLDLQIIADSANDENRQCWHRRKYRQRIEEIYGLQLDQAKVWDAKVWVNCPTLLRLANYRADARSRREEDVLAADAWMETYAEAKSDEEKTQVRKEIKAFLVKA